MLVLVVKRKRERERGRDAVLSFSFLVYCVLRGEESKRGAKTEQKKKIKVW